MIFKIVDRFHLWYGDQDLKKEVRRVLHLILDCQRKTIAHSKSG